MAKSIGDVKNLNFMRYYIKIRTLRKQLCLICFYDKIYGIDMLDVQNLNS